MIFQAESIIDTCSDYEAKLIGLGSQQREAEDLKRELPEYLKHQLRQLIHHHRCALKRFIRKKLTAHDHHGQTSAAAG